MNKRPYFAEVSYLLGNKQRNKRIVSQGLVKDGYIFLLNGKIKRAAECGLDVMISYFGIPLWATKELVDEYTGENLPKEKVNI